MIAWFLVGLVIGAVAGTAGAWYWFTQRPGPAARVAEAPILESPPAPDDLSQTAQRFLTDLERKYEGIGSAGPEATAPKRRRKRPEPPAPVE